MDTAHLSEGTAYIPPLNLPVEVPLERRIANAEASLTRGLPYFTELEDYAFGRVRSAALVSGGPSARTAIAAIAKHRNLFACGSVHDWLVGEEGIIPKYCVIFDPGPAHWQFYLAPHRAVIYLVSSTCDPAVFDALEGQRVHTWHPFDDTPAELYGAQPRVGGGSSVTLRAIALAHVLGYREQHHYGFDSCHLDGAAHADRITVSFNGRQFSTTPQLLQQAQEFIRIYTDHQHMLMCVMHGDGLIAAILRDCSVSNYSYG